MTTLPELTRPSSAAGLQAATGLMSLPPESVLTPKVLRLQVDRRQYQAISGMVVTMVLTALQYLLATAEVPPRRTLQVITATRSIMVGAEQ